MIMQIAMVPNIFDWSENAPINPNKREEKSDEADEDSSNAEENFLTAF